MSSFLTTATLRESRDPMSEGQRREKERVTGEERDGGRRKKIR
jgi:hypothetical protein